MPSSKEQVANHLKNAKELYAVGNKPLSKRTHLQEIVMRGALAVALLGGLTHALVNEVRGTSVLSSNETFSTQEEFAQARVVGKMRFLGGAELGSTPHEKTQFSQQDVWQPGQDAPNASHQFLLDVGDIQPVVVSVSPSLYDKYCEHVDVPKYSHRSSPNSLSENCGTNYVSNDEETISRHVDTIPVSFTRSKQDGTISLTSFGDHPKASTSLGQILSQKRQFEKTAEQAPVYYRNTTPRG